MFRWRIWPGTTACTVALASSQCVLGPADFELYRLIKALPRAYREFRASDFRQPISQAAYHGRVLDVGMPIWRPTFAAILPVHVSAVMAGQISL
jgi:hypothetical protein